MYHRCRLIAAVCVMCALCTIPTAGWGWDSRGIGGGGAFYSPSLSPFDPGTLYLATDMSAVFRTGDFGRSWSGVHFLQLQGGIDSHVRFTADPSVLYAVNRADDAGTPSTSPDGGATWVPLASDPTYAEAFSLHADPGSTQRILVSSWDELFFSGNGGAGFSSVHTASNPGAGLHIAGVFWDGDDIFVGTNDGMLVSQDGGLSFHPCFTFSYGQGIPDDEAMVSFAGGKEGGVRRFFAVTMGADDIWAGITGSEYWGYRAVYRINWGIGEWEPVTSGITADQYAFFVAMAKDDIDTAYVAGCDAGASAPMVFRTINGGQSWTDVFITLHNGNIVTGWSGDGGDEEWWYGEYALGFAVSPVDSRRAVLTDLGFVHVTDTAGTLWRQAYVDSADENPAGSDTPPGRAYAGIGLEDTSGWWLHWVGQDTLIAALTDIKGMRSLDGGTRWTAGAALGLPHNSTYHVVGHPGGALYAATSTVHDLYQSTYLRDAQIDGGDGWIIVSNDAGASWQMLHDFNHPVIWLCLDPNDSQTMYASVVHSTQGGIYVTHNLDQGSGASWVLLASPPRTEGHPLCVHVLDDGSLVAGYSGRRTAGGAFTQSSGVFVSTNGGVSWVDRSDPGMYRWTKDVVIDPHDQAQNTWYAAVFSHWGSYPNEVGGLYRTNNRGVSWTRVSDLYRVESITVHTTDPEVAHLSTETAGLWRTDNLTAVAPTFTPVADYPFRHPVRMFHHPSDTDELWVTSFGNGLRVKRLGAFAQIGGRGRRELNLGFEGAMPTPGWVDVVMTLAEPERVEFGVFDVSGRRVRTLIDGWLGRGEHRMRWDGRTDSGEPVRNGTYVCAGKAGAKTASAAAVVLR